MRTETANSALSFSDAFGTEPEFWLMLQMYWDLWHAKQSHTSAKSLPKKNFNQQDENKK